MSDSIIETQYGKVRGTSHGTVSVWKGIPFAQPPVGKLRFRPPQPPEPWTGVRDATKFGLIAPQVSAPLASLFGNGATEIPTGEDCLYLNVWSPGVSGKKRPVLVWIHGGGFVGGSGSTPWYDGTAFATHGDVVIVTLNYRLGVLGFLYLGDLISDGSASIGNYGMLDQVAALQWVHDNIEAFGGDPDNVTVVGESAGAMSIGVLLAMPSARGLFQKAVLQSGASHGVPTREIASKVAREFLSVVGTDDAASLMELPVAQLLEAQAHISRRRGLLSLRPAVDGISLPVQPFAAYSTGSADGVALLIGTNRDEMKLFTAMDPQQAKLDEAVLKHLFGETGSEVISTYAAAHPGESQDEAWVDFLTDRTFRIPAIRLAESQVKRDVPVWMYRFDWLSTAFEGRLGACHALEIPFVWDNLNRAGASPLTGESPTRQALADKMHASWIAFLQNGDPNTSTLPQWPAYTTEQRATMIFNDECQVMNDPQSAERRLWDGVL